MIEQEAMKNWLEDFGIEDYSTLLRRVALACTPESYMLDCSGCRVPHLPRPCCSTRRQRLTSVSEKGPCELLLFGNQDPQCFSGGFVSGILQYMLLLLHRSYKADVLKECY